MSERIITKISPPELSRRWGISLKKVLYWVHSGQLRTINAGMTPNQKPRLLIDLEDIKRFEEGRAFTPDLVA